mmetsp:Transcript_11578/g.36835  ORF Transcript_11578/g.36835 Transcript_11578/m.36835 type:complete len:243 (+) Transcript_11578:48-776(+)
MWRSWVCCARALPVDHGFFSNAARHNQWSQETAWVWGWLLADGCVHHRGRTYRSIQLGVQHVDRDVLEKVKLLLQSEHKICDFVYSGRRNRWGQQLRGSCLSFSSARMADDLAVLGVVPRKTRDAQFCPGLLEPRNVCALPHAVRGIFEGDGCLSYRSSRAWSLQISGSEGVTRVLQGVLAQHTGGPAVGSRCLQAGSTWVLSFQGNRSVPHLCEWMYSGAAPACVLERKCLLARRARELLR